MRARVSVKTFLAKFTLSIDAFPDGFKGSFNGQSSGDSNDSVTENLVNSGPERLAQLLDKLLANAVEFSTINTCIDIELTTKNDLFILTISNISKLLPIAIQDRLFDSMVSVRKNNQDQQPHLGLGLYITQLIAQFRLGTVELMNNESATGVDAIVTIPSAKK